MTDKRRYYCIISVDATFNAGNLPSQNISDLNERIREVFEEWKADMESKGLSVDIGCDWSEQCVEI